MGMGRDTGRNSDGAAGEKRAAEPGRVSPPPHGLGEGRGHLGKAWQRPAPLLGTRDAGPDRSRERSSQRGSCPFRAIPLVRSAAPGAGTGKVAAGSPKEGGQLRDRTLASCPGGEQRGGMS